jgi:hypothetical protein
MIEWNIQARAHACTACGRTFADKETYHTLLFDERAEFRRSDVCEECWQKQFSDGARERKGFISYWHGVYEAPQPRAEVIAKENAESLLRKIIELNDPRLAPTAFILAVMLERKRLLKVKEQLVREGQRVFIYEQPKTGDVFTIIDPNLQLNQLEAVQRDVAHLLEHGLPEPGNLPQAQLPVDSVSCQPPLATVELLPATPPGEMSVVEEHQPETLVQPVEPR